MFWKKTFCFIAMSAFVIMALTGTAQAVNTHALFVQGNPVHEPANDNNVFIQSNVLDFSGLTYYVTGGVTVEDVVQLLEIPAGTYVMSVGIRVATDTIAGVTLVGVTVGDGADPNGWITDYSFTTGAASNHSGVSTSQEEGIAGVYHTTYGGKFYSTWDTIDLTLPDFSAYGSWLVPDPESGLTSLVLRVWAVCIKPDTQKAYGSLR